VSRPNGSDFAARNINVRMDGPTEQRVPCPHCDHGPDDDALGVNVDSGVFNCFRCGWRGRVGGASTEPCSIRPAAPDPRRVANSRERLDRIWNASAPLNANTAGAKAVRNYLAVRGLDQILREPPACLRAHSALQYWDDGRQVGVFPAMVAQFRGRDESVVSLHQTFLKSDGSGKATVRAPKKLLPVAVSGATNGGAIRLYEKSKDLVLGIAEGIESALSLRLLLGIPVWSTYCAAGIIAVSLPLPVSKLYIGIDIDENGAGEAAAQVRVRQIRQSSLPERPTQVILVRPAGTGPRDLNDELLARKRTRCQS
jgi:hypothetical protein